VFYYNPDEDSPTSGPTALKGFVTACLGPPAQILAGSCGSQCILHPSTKVCDSNNVESARLAGKHKVANKPSVWHVACKINLSNSDKENTNPDVNDEYSLLVEDLDDECEQPDDDGGNMDINTKNANKEYLKTKSMGNTDCNVSASCVPLYLT